MNRRRHPKSDLLNVKVQTDSRLHPRLRVAGALLGTLMVIVLCGYGLQVLGKFAVRRLVFENPRFIITRLVVQNDGVLSPELILRVAGVAEGQNLLAMNLDQARRNLEAVPLVRRAVVRRVLPDKLMVRVEERVPVAQLQVALSPTATAEFYIDRTGVVMKPLRLTDGTLLRPQTSGPLPTLTGLTMAELPRHPLSGRAESEQVYRALHLLDLLAQSAAGALAQAERVDLSRPRTLVMTTQQRTVVRFDTEEMSQQLRRLAVIWRWAQARQKTMRQIDLTVGRNVPVTFADQL